MPAPMRTRARAPPAQTESNPLTRLFQAGNRPTYPRARSWAVGPHEGFFGVSVFTFLPKIVCILYGRALSGAWLRHRKPERRHIVAILMKPATKKS